MAYENVLEYQERLVKNYKYRPLPTLQRDEARNLYLANLPDGFCVDGAQVPVFTDTGLKIASGYNRVVIGDYGAFVEILPEQIVDGNIRTKPGEEYRDENPRYSGKVTFSWKMPTDGSGVKIQFQKREVGHTDMVPGRYYVSVYECMPPKMQEQFEADKYPVTGFTQESLEVWLKENGLYEEGIMAYYLGLEQGYGNAISCAILHNVPPWRVALWLCIDDVCQGRNPLSFEQYEAVSYNLNVIGCVREELCGKLEVLLPEVRIAVEMGLEGLEFPYSIQNLPSSSIRALLRLPFEDLMTVSRFSKVIAGHKAEEAERVHPCGNVDALVADARVRSSVGASYGKEIEPELV